MTTRTLKHLSSIANDVVQRCALKVESSVDGLVEEFGGTWKAETGEYSRKFVEFCSTKALSDLCRNIEEEISNGSFSRFTFDMMLAWEVPSDDDELSKEECVAKEKEEKKVPEKVTSEQDEIPLFYSDLMPLLVDHDADIGEDAFEWMGSLVPLISDPVNGRFTFETLTVATGHRLHFPAYDKFLKEIDKCIKHLQKQAPPKAVELADDEFILHVEGTASTQRVVRHIGSTSWPGRLTLTNYGLYFEASGVITYEDALKIDLSKNINHSIKPASTGPWGAPLFDKAISYESPDISDAVVLEFPEMTSSTRRDHWLALIKEIMLLHQFLSKFKVENLIQAWEMHSGTILGIIRLHAAREMLRISPPVPAKFLIFSLCEEIPKGDYVLQELSESLKLVNCGHPCSATSILRNMNMSQSASISPVEIKEIGEESGTSRVHLSLETAVNQAREEEKEIAIAKATSDRLKDEGISESTLIFMELMRPLKSAISSFKEVLTWERPAITVTMAATALIVTYNEWVGKTMAALLFWVVAKILQARKERVHEKFQEIVVNTASNQSTMESIVSAQQGLQNVHEMVQTANVAALKMWSIFISKAHKQADMVIMALIGLAIILATIPTKFIIMGVIIYCSSSTSKIGKHMSNDHGGRRLQEWWDSIPVIHVRFVDKLPDNPGVDAS